MAAGREIGGHRLLVRLGGGGMGEVWAAERLGPIGFSKLVALKLLRAPDLDANTAVMFLDEARVAGGLVHPAVVPTLDVGREGALAWIAMELVRGPSLNLLLARLAARRAAMAPALVAHVGERVASAIDYAFHDASDGARRMAVVHRDVSPENVLVDGTGRVLLTDFGIARSTVQSHETAGGVFRGKPAYASPEQLRGGALDDRSDLFSLGVVLWECATGRRLFGRKTADASIDAVLAHVPKPLVALVPGFPEPLAHVIERMLAKDRDARFATAGEVARALADVERALSGGTGSTEALAALVQDLASDVTHALDTKLDEARFQLGQTRVRAVDDASRAPHAEPTSPAGTDDDAVARGRAPEALGAAALAAARTADGGSADVRRVLPPWTPRSLVAIGATAFVLSLAATVLVATYGVDERAAPVMPRWDPHPTPVAEPAPIAEPTPIDPTPVAEAAPIAEPAANEPTPRAEPPNEPALDAPIDDAPPSDRAAPQRRPRTRVERADDPRVRATERDVPEPTTPPTLAVRAARAWTALAELERAADPTTQRLRAAFVEAKAAGDDEALEAVVERIEAQVASRTPRAR